MLTSSSRLDYAIRAQGISKSYQLGQLRDPYLTLRETLGRWARGPVANRAAAAHDRHFWALRDVSFDLRPGEVLGVIGRNGAGKSTLLKVLSRITKPTRGTVEIQGHLGSLLEVGSGFHPELTGRENIFLNGAILGMKRSEIVAKFDEIVSFAEVAQFLDTPVKRYSSGMYLRLAFAIAAHLEPDILIVDEVLAVGDAVFQKKCIGRMNELSTSEGRTVVFVSHNLSAVRSICTRGLLLDRGQVVLDDNVEKVLSRYAALASTQTDPDVFRTYLDTVRLNSIELIDAQADPVNRLNINCGVGILIDFEVLSNNQRPDIWVAVYTIDGALAFGSVINSAQVNYNLGRKRLVCWIPPNLLNATGYTIRVTCLDLQTHKVFFDIDNALTFDVDEDVNERSVAYRGTWYGSTRPALKWEYR